MREAIVLCGGLGTRLSPVLKDVPKALAPIAGRPFIEWQLLQLRSLGVTRAVLATGHLADQIEAALGDGERLGIQLAQSTEPAPLGTGGAARLAFEQVRGSSALVVNGDSWCPFDLARLERTHEGSDALATLWLASAPDSGRYGTVETDPGGRVTSFLEKAPGAGPGFVSGGVYLLERAALAERAGVFSLELDVFPDLVRRGALWAVRGGGDLLDIGTPESYDRATTVMGSDPVLERLDAEAELRAYFQAAAETQRLAAERLPGAIADAARRLASAFEAGGKVLLCGNGGSAADCQHMAAELTSSLRRDNQRAALPAIALTTDTSFLTAYANDYGFEGVFARQVEALGRRGDVLLVISTSGRSENVRRAAAAAKAAGLATIGLLGDGSDLAAELDCAVEVPSRDTQHIQETMLVAEHAICSLVEKWLFARD